MGVPFSGDDDSTMIDVTPIDARRPSRAEPKVEPIAEPTALASEEVGDLEPEQAAETDAEEPSAADAYQLGEEAFDAKHSIFSFPKEWEQMKRSDLVDAFKEGFRAREADVKAAKEAK